MAVEDIKKEKLTDDELDEVAGGGESGSGASAERDLEDNESKINDPLKIVKRPLEHTSYLNRKFV